MKFFSEEQLKKMLELEDEYRQSTLLLRSLLEEKEKGGIKTTNENAAAILDGIIKYLHSKAQTSQMERYPYTNLIDQYYKEHDRIIKDFDDDFIQKPETIAALQELEEQYREKAKEIGKPQERLSQIM